MEPYRQSMRPRSSLASAENILRIGRGEQQAQNPAVRDGELTRKGQAALDLVHQVADTISQTENRIETLLVRALEQLKTMEERNRALEERAAQAEARARDAEKWLMRLHVEMEDKFTSWKGAQARERGGPAAA
jgi:TolA-binding protein